MAQSLTDVWVNNETTTQGDIHADYAQSYAVMEKQLPNLKNILEEIKVNGTGDDAMQFAIDIIQSQNYQDAVAAKEYARYARKIAAEKKTIANSHLDTAIKNNFDVEKLIQKGKFPADFDPNDVYTYGQQALVLNERFVGFSGIADEYKNIIADALYFSLKNRPDVADFIAEYKGDTIGNMTPIGEFEPGSRGWLELRQTGAGASDVGALVTKHTLRFVNGNPVTVEKLDRRIGGMVTNLPKNENRRSALEDFHKSKVDPISDEQVEAQTRGQTEFTDASSRGNALEEFIAELYARATGSIVLHNKATWNNPGSAINVNIDGLLTSDGINPDGILEIKTASDPSKWGPTELGLDGVPLNYRAQVLAATYEAGFDRGAVAVLINETEFRYYDFIMNDALRAEASANKNYVTTVMNGIFRVKQEALKNPQNADEILAYDPELYGEAPLRGGLIKQADKVFPKAMLTGSLGGDKGRFFSMIARYRNVDVQDVIDEYVRLDGGVTTSQEGFNEDLLSNFALQAKDPADQRVRHIIYNLVQLMYNSDVSDQILTGVDIETNYVAATMGRIIEIGITAVDMGTGEEVDSYSHLYDVPKESLRSYGTGAEDVHNISVDDISGEPLFDDEKEQEIVLEKLKENYIVFAHNANFEKQFLRSQLKGFAEAEYNNEIYVMDTMDFVKKTMPSAKNNKLEAFCEGNNVAYENAHRALQDAQMMMRALFNWQSSRGGETVFSS